MNPVIVFFWTLIVTSFSTVSRPKDTLSLSVAILVSMNTYEYRAIVLFIM